MTEDDWGCLIFGAVLVGGGIWAYNTYEIRKIEPPKVVLPKMVDAPKRPVGLLAFGPDNDGTVWQIDADSVRGPRDARQGWITTDASKDKTVAFREKKTLYSVNCATMGAKVLSEATYGADGKNLTAESHEPTKAQTDYYPPGTIGYTIATQLCRPEFDAPK